MKFRMLEFGERLLSPQPLWFSGVAPVSAPATEDSAEEVIEWDPAENDSEEALVIDTPDVPELDLAAEADGAEAASQKFKRPIPNCPEYRGRSRLQGAQQHRRAKIEAGERVELVPRVRVGGTPGSGPDRHIRASRNLGSTDESEFVKTVERGHIRG
ncbi:hypothetical protein [Leucobacter sp. wl10]|uniref:hypothetical protein n=1 Tax=Leucobacter sp. wl10 TaxID=2304677 RepID=UPI0013C29FEC|nr:hypothetical protein [Leucobacter sp. wl10]